MASYSTVVNRILGLLGLSGGKLLPLALVLGTMITIAFAFVSHANPYITSVVAVAVLALNLHLNSLEAVARVEAKVKQADRERQEMDKRSRDLDRRSSDLDQQRKLLEEEQEALGHRLDHLLTILAARPVKLGGFRGVRRAVVHGSMQRYLGDIDAWLTKGGYSVWRDADLSMGFVNMTLQVKRSQVALDQIGLGVWPDPAMQEYLRQQKIKVEEGKEIERIRIVEESMLGENQYRDALLNYIGWQEATGLHLLLCFRSDAKKIIPDLGNRGFMLADRHDPTMAFGTYSELTPSGHVRAGRLFVDGSGFDLFTRLKGYYEALAKAIEEHRWDADVRAVIAKYAIPAP